MTALSENQPALLILHRISNAFSSDWNPMLLYWLPWSEWYISPAGLPLRHIAIIRASDTMTLVMLFDIDHPTIRLENKSMTAARYSHPSDVSMYIVTYPFLVGRCGSNVSVKDIGKSRLRRPWSLCHLLRGRAKSSCFRIKRPTRWSPHVWPFSSSTCLIRRAP